MGTEISVTLKERECLARLLGMEFIKEAWFVGGSLRRETSKDIDIVVVTTKKTTLNNVAFDQPGFEVQACFQHYSEGDDWLQGKDCVIKLIHEDCRPIDLLMVSNDWTGDITSYMTKYFPLDIQRIAMNVFTGEVKDIYPGGNYIIVKPGIAAYSPTVLKYMGYYPDHIFLKEIKNLEFPPPL